MERTQVKRLSDDTVLFSLKTTPWDELSQTVSGNKYMLFKNQKYEQSQVTWKSVGPNCMNNPCYEYCA